MARKIIRDAWRRRHGYVRKHTDRGRSACQPAQDNCFLTKGFIPMRNAYPKQNSLLALLSAAEFDRLAPQLELVAMAQGDVLYQSGSQLTYVYFPTTAVISIQYELEDGGASEIASVGNEGLLGVTLFMGGAAAPNRAIVHSAGHAYRLRASVLLTEFHRKGPLFDLLLRYTQVLMAQLAQSAVCNGHHSTVQRLCRWLLQALDPARTPRSRTRPN
jgi:CRP-like cAMP-binding protein